MLYAWEGNRRYATPDLEKIRHGSPIEVKSGRQSRRHCSFVDRTCRNLRRQTTVYARNSPCTSAKRSNTWRRWRTWPSAFNINDNCRLLITLGVKLCVQHDGRLGVRRRHAVLRRQLIYLIIILHPWHPFEIDTREFARLECVQQTSITTGVSLTTFDSERHCCICGDH